MITRDVDWIKVGGKWTRVSWMKRKNVKSDAKVVMVPGNPGNEGFYEDFGKQLIEKTAIDKNENVEFITVSHLNHVPLPKALDEHQTNEVYLLKDQVHHKLNFFKEHLTKTDRIYLISHSIGSYMALQILPVLESEGYNIIGCCALFPVFEFLPKSSQGIWMKHVFKFFHVFPIFLILLTFWLNFISETTKQKLCQWNLKGSNSHNCILDSAVELLSFNVIKNINHMSVDEMVVIADEYPNLDTVKDKLRLYYAVEDHWVPHGSAERNLQKYGSKCVRIDEHGCKHAFVISHSVPMVNVVVSLLNEFNTENS
uniref:Lipid droplet-associated hydrolase n=1 Tax=Panagrolaimus sp. PS1159 TaxID=55785 RepID=A0AC35F0T3_9BILA